jgi:hypothetical protein
LQSDFGFFEIVRREDDRRSAALSSRKNDHSSSRSSTSTPAVGSSRISKRGSWISARAIVSRRFMPPERRVYGCFAFEVRSKRSSSSSARASTCLAVKAVVAGLINEDVANVEVAVEVVLLRREADHAARGAPIFFDVEPEELRSNPR